MSAGRSDHVLVVGIDGVRYDTLLATTTPALDAITARGFLAPIRVNDAGPTISGPSWATIVTGVLAPTHGIFGNDLAPNALAEHPDVVELARRERPGLDSFVAAAWGPLVRSDSGGPLFATGGWFPGDAQPHEMADWHVADQAVTEAAVAFIADHDGSEGSLVFAYLGGVDEVGHTLGTGADYTDFLAASDARLGALVEAVDTRATARDERWTVLVVTDHGHVDGGGHGGDSELERTAWIAAAGPSVPTVAPEALEQADIAGHVVHALGLTVDDPDFVGRPIGTRSRPSR